MLGRGDEAASAIETASIVWRSGIHAGIGRNLLAMRNGIPALNQEAAAAEQLRIAASSTRE